MLGTVLILLLRLFMSKSAEDPSRYMADRQQAAIDKMNTIVLHLESHKRLHDVYPNTLSAISEPAPTQTANAWELYPSQNFRGKFIYQRDTPTTYCLLGRGADGTPDTADDLRPTVFIESKYLSCSK